MSKATATKAKVPASECVDTEVLEFRSQFDEEIPLKEIVRRGAQEMLQAAIEVDQFIVDHRGKHDEQGRRLVVRKGRLPAREVLTGAGPLGIEQPRARDNDPDEENRIRFTPSIIPQ